MKPQYIKVYESGQASGLEFARTRNNYTACLIAHTNASVARDCCKDNQRYYHMGYIQALEQWMKDYEHQLIRDMRGW